nr:reverse transcriptase domain-containing protein [Tanacetum cinerariifolium]
MTPVEKKSSNKFCDFHNDKGHSTNECMQLKKQIEELVRAGKLSHLIKEIKLGRDQSKAGKKETAVKDKPTAIYMVQSWQRTVKQKAVPSTVHGMLKFPVEGGIATIRSTILIHVECTSVNTSPVIPGGDKSRLANFTVALHPDFPDQEVVIGGSLSDKGRTLLCSDCYPLPEIDMKVESLCGYPFKCFLDAYKGYHQIQLAEADEEKTAFQTRQGVYCYTKMPFGLKNAGATYQRLMDKAFKSQTLKKCIKKSDFSWTVEAEQAFQQLKQHLSELPLLVAPKPQEELIMYLSATYGAVSAVLITERGTTQTPINFISHALQGPELNYSPMEKLSIMLGEHNITYRPRTSVKGQILANFLVEMPGDVSQAAPAAVTQEEPWTLFTNGSSCVDGPGAGLILTNPEGVEFTYALRFQFMASNNEVEYEALVAGLRIAVRMGVKNLQVNVDSKPVANQVLGTYVAKEDNMINKNKKADALSKIASTSFAHLSKQVLVEVLENKSIKEKEVATMIKEDGLTWMTQLVEYLKEGVLLEDKNEKRKLRLKARQYELMKGVLYRRSFLTPWLRCVGQLQADYVMREIHEGSCSMHTGPRSVVATAVRLGYYWPTMHRDTRDMIRKCNDCQIHRPVTRHPQQSLTPNTTPWPFYKWGIDIAGPFLEGPGKVKFLIVAMDYFTKWIEAKAFADNPFKDWCDKLNITQRFASVKHPQSNRLVERANRSLREGIKARLGEGNKNWVEELPRVLWAHRTMIKSSHGDTLFSLTYGTEAVIPTKIGIPTYRTAAVDVVNNDEELRLNLDLLEERRERAAVCEAKAKSKMMKYYNARVRGVAFKPGDFVYRSNDASHAIAGGKLGPKWEGPYEVTEALGNGAYKLRSTDGTVLPRTWNITNLKRCYL